MLNKVPEKQMHYIRWVLAVGWLVLIFSLFFDPISVNLTDPNKFHTPFNIDPDKCVKVQGVCLPQSPYEMGARFFWAAIVPAAIFIILVFGHEFWRRICPLSFMSQIPRALGLQRQRKTIDPNTNEIVIDPNTKLPTYEVVPIEENSWLGKNHLRFQFGLFCLGLTARILFVNSDRIALGLFLIFTILCAMVVGFLYAGKTWCNYFCPMAPVQMVYTGPQGLLGSQAHKDRQESIPQSMCRTVYNGQEIPNCDSCKSLCIDVDAEKVYWKELELNKPGRRLVQYGYLGMVVAFYFYYFLYAGNWDYYFSGAWTHEENQIDKIFQPGFYILQQAIPIPKIFAVPITFAFFVGMFVQIGLNLEKAYKAYRMRRKNAVSDEQAQHIIFTLCTVASFWIFFSFGGRPNLNLLPEPLLLAFNALVVLVGYIWLSKTLSRTSQQYYRKSLKSPRQERDLGDEDRNMALTELGIKKPNLPSPNNATAGNDITEIREDLTNKNATAGNDITEIGNDLTNNNATAGNDITEIGNDLTQNNATAGNDITEIGNDLTQNNATAGSQITKIRD